MAKKFVRGVTGVDDIEKLDKSLTNVNDLVSDGQNTYVHTKKGKNELYYNITNSVNQVKSSDDTLTITKDNDTVTIANNTLATKQELATEKSSIDGLLAQKQNKVVNNGSIGVLGDSLQMLYTWYSEYNNDNGLIKTHTKEMSNNTSVYNVREQFNFIVKINKEQQSASFTLNEHDMNKFNNIVSLYGSNNTVRIDGLIFTLDGSSLTVTKANIVEHDYVITFSDIL